MWGPSFMSELLNSVLGVKPIGVPFNGTGPAMNALVARPEAARLFRFYKPPSTLTAARDPKGRPTIYDRLPPGLPR